MNNQEFQIKVGHKYIIHTLHGWEEITICKVSPSSEFFKAKNAGDKWQRISRIDFCEDLGR